MFFPNERAVCFICGLHEAIGYYATDFSYEPDHNYDDLPAGPKCVCFRCCQMLAKGIGYEPEDQFAELKLKVKTLDTELKALKSSLKSFVDDVFPDGGATARKAATRKPRTASRSRQKKAS